MLEDLKLMLGFEDEDDREPLLELIVKLTEQRLCYLLGGLSETPSELSYIAFEVSVKRFNKIGSEGLSSHSVEGENLVFKDSDFDEFEKDIESWLARQGNDNPAKGGIKFI